MTSDPYARMAPIYDLVTAPFLDPMRRAVCRLAQAAGVRRAVDMCCGTGRQAWMLAAMGVAPTLAGGSLRLSLGAPTTEHDVEVALQAVPAAVERLRLFDRSGQGD